MKKLLFLAIPAIAGTLALISCGKGAKTTDAGKDSAATLYKATYSSSFSIPDSAKLVQLVLQSYKDWENNNLKNASAYFADTIAWDQTDGTKHRMVRDSMVKFFNKYRDSLSSSKIDMAAFIPLHSNDKKEDWVLTWYKQTDTYKNGKVDSTFYHDLNHIKNGKIDYISSLRQTLKSQK